MSITESGQSIFQVDRGNIQCSRVVHAPLPALEADDILLRVDRFAFTTNNITYAVFGDELKYWNFFPVEAPWGVIPVWGFADVIASRHGEIPEGERLYGYFPMATHVRMRAGRVAGTHLNDMSAHRQELPPAYNRYVRVAHEPSHVAAWENHDAAFRPLVITSFLIDDFLADENFFGARQVLLTSASSKTALGLAYFLRTLRRGQIEVVGLTSASNVGFTEQLGSYDRVVRYDDIANLSPDTPSVLVDFAGNRTVRRSVHSHFADALKFSCAVGSTHPVDAAAGGAMPGPKPVFFFAPDRIRKRRADWGAGRLEQRFAEAWPGFVGSTERWLKIIEGRGAEAVEAVYRDIAAGRVRPDEARILSMWP